MDATMYRHPLVRDNLERLKRLGVELVEPREEEDKAKLADLEEIIARVLRRLGPRELSGRSVLVIGGATREPIDDMRIVSNRSTGLTAVALAREAHRLGADVELWMGHCEVAIPPYLPCRRFETVEDILSLVPKASRDYCLVPAAISDFAPAKAQGKISSDENHISLEFRATPKVIKALRPVVGGILVGFKAEARVTPAELKRRALERLKEWGADFVVANDIVREEKGDEAQVLVLDRTGKAEEMVGPKSLVAVGIWGAILHGVRG
jgi:phosphopantothenoylcysteine decarboxylase/phosphopantothenate--cysteine ligase